MKATSHFTSIEIPMLKIRWSQDCLIFNMGIPIPWKDRLYIEMGPRGWNNRSACEIWCLPTPYWCQTQTELWDSQAAMTPCVSKLWPQSAQLFPLKGTFTHVRAGAGRGGRKIGFNTNHYMCLHMRGRGAEAEREQNPLLKKWVQHPICSVCFETARSKPSLSSRNGRSARVRSAYVWTYPR